MEQIQNFGDSRLAECCAHCGRVARTRDHAPSKVFLDTPYPANPPWAPSCLECNQSFSLDEEYVACAIEVAKAGGIDRIRRPKVREILTRSAALASRLDDARRSDALGDLTLWVEEQRVARVVLKLARCHAVYECNDPQLEKPHGVAFSPLCTLTADQRHRFEEVRSVDGFMPWPEVGSRLMQRVAGVGTDLVDGWIEVQRGRYRYSMSNAPMAVRIVIGEYLAAEVRWG